MLNWTQIISLCSTQDFRIPVNWSRIPEITDLLQDYMWERFTWHQQHKSTKTAQYEMGSWMFQQPKHCRTEAQKEQTAIFFSFSSTALTFWQNFTRVEWKEKIKYSAMKGLNAQQTEGRQKINLCNFGGQNKFQHKQTWWWSFSSQKESPPHSEGYIARHLFELTAIHSNICTSFSWSQKINGKKDWQSRTSALPQLRQHLVSARVIAPTVLY